MWDKPEVLNGVANFLLAAAFLLAAYGSLHYALRLPIFPVREVHVSGPLAHVTFEQVEAIVKRELKGNFFTLDLNGARAGFEKLPWVRKANARRHWPDRLDVALEEHVALARWGNAALVNTKGELFNAAYDGTPGSEPGPAQRGAGARVQDGSREPGALPLFAGPEDRVKEMAIQYGYFLRSLAAIGRVPVQVQVSARRAWQLRLDNGLVIELGREHIESRLDRFVAVFDRTVGHLQRRLDYVDLRYSNGFALRIPELRLKPQDMRPGGGNTKRG